MQAAIFRTIFPCHSEAQPKNLGDDNNPICSRQPDASLSLSMTRSNASPSAQHDKVECFAFGSA